MTWTHREPQIAEFDTYGHADIEGWATYHDKPMRRFRVRCWMGRHAWPLRTPIPANGHSPSNYDHCVRCHAAIHWFVEGQHRYGSLNRYFANLSA